MAGNLTKFTALVVAGVSQTGLTPASLTRVPVFYTYSTIDNLRTVTHRIGTEPSGFKHYTDTLDYDGGVNYLTAPTNPFTTSYWANYQNLDTVESGGTIPSRLSYGPAVADAEECATRCLQIDQCVAFGYVDNTQSVWYVNACALYTSITLSNQASGAKTNENFYYRNEVGGWTPTAKYFGTECSGSGGTFHDSFRDDSEPMTPHRCKDYCYDSITERIVIDAYDTCQCWNLTECGSLNSIGGSVSNNAEYRLANTMAFDLDMVLDYTPRPTPSPTQSPTTVAPTRSPIPYTPDTYVVLSEGGNLRSGAVNSRTCYDPKANRIDNHKTVNGQSINGLYYYYGIDPDGAYNYVTQAQVDGANADQQYDRNLWFDTELNDGVTTSGPQHFEFDVGETSVADCKTACDQLPNCVGIQSEVSSPSYCKLMTHCQGRANSAQSISNVHWRKSFYQYGFTADAVAPGNTCTESPDEGLTSTVPITPGECFQYCQQKYYKAFVINDMQCECYNTCSSFVRQDKATTYTIRTADLLTRAPTKGPTKGPTRGPTKRPTQSPTTPAPTQSPTTPAPTQSPTTAQPTKAPTRRPTTKTPTRSPTTAQPTKSPTTRSPTRSPTTRSPTASPTGTPPVSLATPALIVPAAVLGVAAIGAVLYCYGCPNPLAGLGRRRDEQQQQTPEDPFSGTFSRYY